MFIEILLTQQTLQQMYFGLFFLLTAVSLGGHWPDISAMILNAAIGGFQKIYNLT